MKNLCNVCLIVIAVTVTSSQAFAGQTIKQWMNDYYSNFDETTNCRFDDEKKMCIRLKQAEQVNTKYGKRLYLLMTGNVMGGTARALGGMAGVFVFAPDGDNTWKVLSADSMIEIGSSGESPDEWSFHKFAPNTYGFLTATGYGMGGQFNGAFSIFTPNGKGIQHSFIDSYASYQAERCKGADEYCYDLSSTIKIDRSNLVNGYYPLTLTVNGFDEQTKYRNKKYQATYKRGKGYVLPKNHPFGE